MSFFTTGMKVLSIGSDRKLFEEGSSVASRSIEYGEKMEELHIVVFSLRLNNFKQKKISPHVTLYPTNSSFRIFYIWDAIRIGKRIVSDQKFVLGDSVITCQDPFESGFVGWRIAKKFGLPLHLQIHTDFLSPYFQNSILQKLRVSIARFLLPRANFVRVVSLRISESLKKSGTHLQHEPKILPIRIDVESLEDKKSTVSLSQMFPQFKFTILMASRLTDEKNIKDALTTFSITSKLHPHIGLIIAGDGPLRKNLEQKSRELGIEKQTVFLGWRDDIFSLMKSSNMFLSTSRYEGYGMTLLEAGLAKCPVLTTNVGISEDILVHKKNSYICPVDDIMCLHEGIEALVGDNGMRYNMAENLAFDIQKLIPSKEAYITQYIALLIEASKIND